MKTKILLIGLALFSSCSEPEEALIAVTLEADLTQNVCSGGIILKDIENGNTLQSFLLFGKEMTQSQMDSLPKSAWITFEPDSKHCSWTGEAINILHIEPR